MWAAALVLAVSCGGGGAVSGPVDLSPWMGADSVYSFTVKDVTFTLAPMKAGTFAMGETLDMGRFRTPALHQVILDGYAIGTTEVTQALWKAVMGSNPSPKDVPTAPVTMVSYGDAQKFLQKLSKGIEILVGSSEGFDECMYSHYVDGNMDGWDHDFEVYSGHQEFLAGKDEAVTGICSRFARNSKKAVLYVNAVGTENSGKNIYALDGGSRLFDNTGKEVFRMPQFAEAGMMFEISKGKVKALPCGGKTAPKSFKPGEPIAQIHDALVYMIRENLKRFHIERMVIGASGGIDSAVSAVLYAEAIGAKNVYLVNMPTKFNSDTTKNAARDLAKNLGCPYMVAPISDMLDAVSGILAKCTFVRNDKKIKIEGLAYENLQARTRSSSVLLSVASVLGAGVTCNGNKSEATAGYCTLYGDTCGVMCALGDLWKTQVYELARYINRKKEVIPKASIDVPASAELSDAMNVDEGKGDPIKYPYHDKLLAY